VRSRRAKPGSARRRSRLTRTSGAPSAVTGDVRFASVLASAALLPSVAAADIGVTRIDPDVARQGETIRITVRGYLGYGPWKPMPVVLVRSSKAPRPYPCRGDAGGGICTPSVYPSELLRPPYSSLGSVRRWRAADNTGANGVGVLTTRIPRVGPGRYLVGLFCASCARGPKGSVIIDYRLVLKVRT
jgi:hypothetical protein